MVESHPIDKFYPIGLRNVSGQFKNGSLEIHFNSKNNIGAQIQINAGLKSSVCPDCPMFKNCSKPQHGHQLIKGNYINSLTAVVTVSPQTDLNTLNCKPIIENI